MLARTHVQLGPIADALEDAGIAVRRNATAQGTPLQAAVRQAAALGSASRLRGWAHDILDAPPPPQSLRHRSHDRRRSSDGRAPTTQTADEQSAPSSDADAERRVAAAVLEFLREQTLGDGAAFRAWVATTNPFEDASTEGVDLLTFHAAKGREWHTVVVSGVESSLMPHKSDTTVAVVPP